MAVVLTPEAFEELRRMVHAQRNELSNLRRHLAHVSVRRHQGVATPVKAVHFRNESGEEVPPYGVMRVTGSDTAGGKELVTIAKPDTSFQRLYLVNGKKAVGDDKTGKGTWLWDAGWVLYDTGTPAYGESWGPQNNSWSLKKWRYGFAIIGNPVAADLKVRASQTWVNKFYGQTDAAITKGSSGTVSVFDGNNADTSINVASVQNKYANVAITKKVSVTWEAGVWRLTSAEC